MPTEWLSIGFKIIAWFANDGNAKNREFET